MLVQALDRFKIRYVHIATLLSPLHGVYHCTLLLIPLQTGVLLLLLLLLLLLFTILRTWTSISYITDTVSFFRLYSINEIHRISTWVGFVSSVKVNKFLTVCFGLF